MTSKTEDEIMGSWIYNDDYLVSVLCATYNHEAYIKDAIESFLIQETNFPFEIIIHDDASTDSTPHIIRAYAEKYPKLIKPIFQNKNQQSQKRNGLLIAFSYSRGKYITLCEGDDYWIHSKKLQIQIEAMGKYPHCYVSFHPVIAKQADGSKPDRVFAKHSNKNKVFTANKVILGASSGFCPTASLMIKRDVFESLPDWFQEVPIGDYFIQVLASLNGGSLYINKAMSVYRRGCLNSWSEKVAKDEHYSYYYFNEMLKSLTNLNAHTNNRFLREINISKKRIYLFMCRNRALSIEKRKEFFIQNKEKFNFKDKLMWFLLYKNKNLLRLLYKIKNG